jgi:diguanylate cyclase (GGDEF)-like protein
MKAHNSHFFSFIKEAPKHIARADHPDYFGILISALAGIVVNIILFFVFAWESHYFLASFCISGIGFWSLSAYWVRQGKFTQAVNIGVFEMMFHVAIIVTQIGTEYGGQMVLWSAVAFASFNTSTNRRLTATVGMLCLIEIALLYAFVPKYTGFESYREYLHFIFIVLTLCSALPLMTVLMSIKSVQIRQQKSLQVQANHDGLTGLFNRGFFDTLLEYDRDTLSTGGGPFCICLADIDYFKKVNDQYGHDSGDEVLKKVSEVISNNLRKSDAVCRWGGEEFAIILRRCKLDDAPAVIEKIRLAICEEPMTKHELNVSMSFGLIIAREEESTESLIKRADKLLYQAKASGRNCVITESQTVRAQD